MDLVVNQITVENRRQSLNTRNIDESRTKSMLVGSRL